MTIRSGTGLWNTAVIGVVALMAAPALAQVQDVAPYYAVVQGKQALRSRDGERFYSVAEFAEKTVVIVDGEGKEWARVYYPAGLSAFVRAEDVTVEGSIATLAHPSKLKAANAVSGFSGSYMSLFAGELAPGTVLKVIEPAKENGGPVVGYRVAAPEGSKGYVEIRTLRRATDGEAAAARAKGSVGALPNTKPGEAKPGEAKPGEALPNTKSGEAKVPEAKPPAPAVDLTATPTAPAGDKPVEVVQKTDPNSPAGATPEPSQMDWGHDVPPVTMAAERKVSDLERLEPTFREVWKQPILNAEFDELLSEYQRAMDDVPAADGRRRQQVQSRIDALTLRQDYRNKLREQEDAKAKLDQTSVKLKTQLEEIAKSRYYTIIGQLQPSLVYNGRDLPQMYRVVSVGGTAPRTLGYLMKTDKFDLQKMVGMVVGVIGEAQLDRSLQLNIITPVQVDMLKSVPVPAMAAPPADSTPAVPKAPAEEQPKTDAPTDSGGQ